VLVLTLLPVVAGDGYLQGTAFSMTERDRLGLRGLLPPNVVSEQQQIDRFST
jgi:malate dehydrogenase (decarboxylating)